MFDFEFHQISGLRPSLLVNKLRLPEKTLLLLFAKIQLQPNGCWLWLAAKRKGYGAVRIRALSAQVLQVHRVCYELIHGPLDPALDIHHKVEDGCIGPSCCNPDHLFAVDHGEHTRDFTPNSLTYTYAHQTKCEAGHEYNRRNLRVLEDGRRQCRECDRIRALEKREAARIRPRYAKDPEKLKKACFRGHSLEDESNLRWIKSKTGLQKVCLACETIRRAWYKEKTENEYFDPPIAILAPTDRCKRGHLLEGDNVYHHPDGKRRTCKACRSINFTKSGKEKEFPMAPPIRLPVPYNEEEMVEQRAETARLNQELILRRTKGPIN